jgi:hypothetical protein
MGGLQVVTVFNEKNVPRIVISGCVVIGQSQKLTGSLQQTGVLHHQVL